MKTNQLKAKKKFPVVGKCVREREKEKNKRTFTLNGMPSA